MTPICERCQGRMYPRQCRNSAGFRKAQRAPAVCPHGIPLNHLPIGDNAPVRTLSPVEGAFRGPDACAHLLVVPTGGCCDNTFYCVREPGKRAIPPSECQACPERQPKGQPTRSALAATAAPRAG